MGKSMMSSMLSQRTGLEWLDVSKIAIENECLEEYDEEYQCSVLDERKVISFIAMTFHYITKFGRNKIRHYIFT